MARTAWWHVWLASALALSIFASCGGEAARHGIGLACSKDSQCLVGLVCVADDPGGQCTKFCLNDGACGDGNLCNVEGKCYQACHSSADCPRAATDSRYGCVGVAPRQDCDVIDGDDGGSTD